MTFYKCSKCGSDDVRQEVSMLVDPNGTEEDFGYALAENRWEWGDFAYCMDCEDSTILKEIDENPV